MGFALKKKVPSTKSDGEKQRNPDENIYFGQS